MNKICSLALIALCVLVTGCPQGRRPAGETAGRAWVEDSDGKRVPATVQGTGGQQSAPTRQPAGSDAEWLQKFELTERSGKTVDSEALKGKPYVLSFFFSTCPTICKRQNDKIAQLQQKFKGQSIKFVSITCDPEVDSPEVLSIYADGFKADPEQWLFLTGDLTYIRRVGAEMYFLPVDRRFHAEKLLLIDADGKIYGAYNWNLSDQFSSLQTDITSMIEAGGRLPHQEASPSQAAVNPEELD